MIAATQKDKTMLANMDLSIDEKIKYGLFYDEYKKFGVGDVSEGKLLTIETNWNSYVDKNRYLKLRIGNEEIIILNSHLRSILKILAPLEDAEELLMHSKRFYQARKKTLKIVAQKPYRRGEEIYFQVEVPERIG